MGDSVILDLIKYYGLPTALLIGAIIFGTRVLWPWMIKQTEVAQKQTSDAISAVAGLKEVFIQHAEIGRRTVEALERIERATTANQASQASQASQATKQPRVRK